MTQSPALRVATTESLAPELRQQSGAETQVSRKKQQSDFPWMELKRESARKFRVIIEVAGDDEAAAISTYQAAQQHGNGQTLQGMFTNYGSYEKTTRSDQQTNFEMWFEGTSYHNVQKVISRFGKLIKNISFVDAG
jgi:hypothetical protein